MQWPSTRQFLDVSWINPLKASVVVAALSWTLSFYRRSFYRHSFYQCSFYQCYFYSTRFIDPGAFSINGRFRQDYCTRPLRKAFLLGKDLVCRRRLLLNTVADRAHATPSFLFKFPLAEALVPLIKPKDLGQRLARYRTEFT